MVFRDAGEQPRHPSQLYEFVLEGVALFLILWLYSARPRPTAAVSGLFLICYGVFRYLVEFVREPDAHIGYLAFGWVTMGHVLTFPMVLLGAGMMVWAYRKNPA
jgi:phosphatidylglycerol:prolipoprotein diacylglycerol transferase